MTTSPANRRLRVALIGAGRVGVAVSELLRRHGHLVVGVASRTRASAEAAAARLNSTVVGVTDERIRDADVVLIGVVDEMIVEVASEIAPTVTSRSIVVHFAGALGTAPLTPVANAGAAVCALHPVQTCPDVDTAIRRLPASAWGVTCDVALRPRIDDLVRRDLDGVPIAVVESDRALWHAAAVTTANGIAALLTAAEEMLATMGIDTPIEVLGPLAAGAVANARDGGGGARTLTGPVVRGDSATIARHVAALDEKSPELLPLYRLVASLITSAARGSRRVEADVAERIERVLGI